VSLIGWVLNRIIRATPIPPVPEFEGLELTTEELPTKKALVDQGILDSPSGRSDVGNPTPLIGSLEDRRRRLRSL
jgi:hypothetical protein